MLLGYKVTIHPNTDLLLAVAAANALIESNNESEDAPKTGPYNAKIFEGEDGMMVKAYITAASTPSIIVKAHDAKDDAPETEE